MAMIQCPKCGQEVSDKAKKCIHCGEVLIEDIVPKKFCSECGQEVSLEATECPHCGCPLVEDEREIREQKRKKLKKWLFQLQ